LTVSAPATSGELVMSESSPIDVDSAIAGDLLLLGLKRLAVDAADTLVGDLEFVSLEVREA